MACCSIVHDNRVGEEREPARERPLLRPEYNVLFYSELFYILRARGRCHACMDARDMDTDMDMFLKNFRKFVESHPMLRIFVNFSTF